MKSRNGVILTGELVNLRAERLRVGETEVDYVTATLITDHAAYGGHHLVLFPGEFALEVQAYAALTKGHLEVTVEGWLRSTPATDDRPPTAAVVVDRVIFMNVTREQRDLVARHKASPRDKAAGPRKRP